MHPIPLLTRAACRSTPQRILLSHRSLPSCASSSSAVRGLASKSRKATSKGPVPSPSSSPSTGKDPAAASASPPSQSQPSPSPPLSDANSETTIAPAPALAPASLSLDFAPPEPTQSDAGRTGARSSRDSLSSIERKRRAMARFGFGMFALALGGGAIWLGREWEDDELVEKRMVSFSLSLCLYVCARPARMRYSRSRMLICFLSCRLQKRHLQRVGVGRRSGSHPCSMYVHTYITLSSQTKAFPVTLFPLYVILRDSTFQNLHGLSSFRRLFLLRIRSHIHCCCRLMICS